MQLFIKIILGPLFKFKNRIKLNIFLVLLAIVLTILTQFGGILLWLFLPFLRWIYKNTPRLKSGVAVLSYISIYLISLTTIVPLLAHLSNRAQLNWYATEDSPIKPVTHWYCLFGRNYVKPELKELLENTAVKMKSRNQKSIVHYIDANFPLFDGFPLLPHLSHNDGKKVDISYYYKNRNTNEEMLEPPSPIGYWVYEQPLPNEAKPCESGGGSLRWDFDWLQNYYDEFEMDTARTRQLIEILCESPLVGKIFIEPHLKERMLLKNDKIRFQGCYAARHDDHIHLQIK